MKLIALGPRSGKFTDVAADADGWACVWQEEGTVPDLVVARLHPDGSRRLEDVRLPAKGGNAFPVLYVDAGTTWLAFRHEGLGGQLVNVTTGLTTPLGLVHGNAPIAVGQGEVWYQADAAYRLWWRHLNELDIVHQTTLAGRPTGLAWATIAGPVLVDDARASEPGMANPRWANGVTVGENADAGPDRDIARLDGTGRECALWPGLASFTPRIASNGQQWAVATWGGPGVRLAILEQADFVVPAPPPEPLPDIPWTTDAHGVVEDIWPWLAAHFTALSPDGRVGFILKSDEVSADGVTIGEWWDRDDRYIGHLEDASTGHRLYQGKRYYAHEWVALGEPVPWASLPLARNRFDDGARLWMPRRCETGQRFRYVTNIRWNNGYVQPNIRIEIHVEVGYGRFKGREAFVRGFYVPGGNAEENWYGPDGWVRHIPAGVA